MSILPQQFSWLEKLGAPKMVAEAVALYGVTEKPGPDSNPVIMGWAKETGLDAHGYTGDEVPWCGLFMAVIAHRAKKQRPVMALRALSWAAFGRESPLPSLGDVLVFERAGGGHVGLYVGEDDANFYVLGGNQSDAVTIAPKEKSRLKACRRPDYVVQPDNVKPIFIGAAIASDTTPGKEV